MDCVKLFLGFMLLVTFCSGDAIFITIPANSCEVIALPQISGLFYHVKNLDGLPLCLGLSGGYNQKERDPNMIIGCDFDAKSERYDYISLPYGGDYTFTIENNNPEASRYYVDITKYDNYFRFAVPIFVMFFVLFANIKIVSE